MVAGIISQRLLFLSLSWRMSKEMTIEEIRKQFSSPQSIPIPVEFLVTLMGCKDVRIKAIKIIRNHLDWDLQRAKIITDRVLHGVPQLILKTKHKSDAVFLHEDLVNVGAEVRFEKIGGSKPRGSKPQGNFIVNILDFGPQLVKTTKVIMSHSGCNLKEANIIRNKIKSGETHTILRTSCRGTADNLWRDLSDVGARAVVLEDVWEEGD